MNVSSIEPLAEVTYAARYFQSVKLVAEARGLDSPNIRHRVNGSVGCVTWQMESIGSGSVSIGNEANLIELKCVCVQASRRPVASAIKNEHWIVF